MCALDAARHLDRGEQRAAARPQAVGLRVVGVARGADDRRAAERRSGRVAQLAVVERVVHGDDDDVGLASRGSRG